LHLGFKLLFGIILPKGLLDCKVDENGLTFVCHKKKLVNPQSKNMIWFLKTFKGFVQPQVLVILCLTFGLQINKTVFDKQTQGHI
jgi:hypothetical protein